MCNNLPESRSGSIPGVSRDLTNTVESSRIQKLNGKRHCIQMPYSNLSNRRTVLYEAAGSQQTMTSSHGGEIHALRGIGKQFKDYQSFSDRGGLIDDIERNTCGHPHHEIRVHRTDTSHSGVIQAHRCPDPDPMQKFSSESRSQQPAVFADPSKSQPSNHGGYRRLSSTPPK